MLRNINSSSNIPAVISTPENNLLYRISKFRQKTIEKSLSDVDMEKKEYYTVFFALLSCLLVLHNCYYPIERTYYNDQKKRLSTIKIVDLFQVVLFI